MPDDLISSDQIQIRILALRGHRVLLDADLAAFYGVPTFRFNEAIKRNAERFPADFRFQLTREEHVRLISQFAISSADMAGAEAAKTGSAPAMMSPRRHGGSRKLPWAFTEHGALMAATVLNSTRAVQMSLVIVRAFVALRRMVADQAALAGKLAELESRVGAHDEQLAALIAAIRQLTDSPEPTHGRRMGFQQGSQ